MTSLLAASKAAVPKSLRDISQAHHTSQRGAFELKGSWRLKLSTIWVRQPKRDQGKQKQTAYINKDYAYVTKKKKGAPSITLQYILGLLQEMTNTLESRQSLPK